MPRAPELLQKIRSHPKRSFEIFLAICYAIGFFLHLLDLFSFRLNFSHMEGIWRSWIIYLFIGDLITAIFLIKKPNWGIVGFHIIAISQLIAYWGFQNYFGKQDFLIVFHILTLTIYWKIVARLKRQEYGDKARYK